MILTQVGTIIEDKGIVRAAENHSGYVLYGPYVKLEPGDYAVTFNVNVHPQTSEPKIEACGRADIAVNKGTHIIGATALYINRLLAAPRFTVSFRIDEPSEVEFRVYTTGRVAMSVHGEPSLIRIDKPQGQYCPVFPVGNTPNNEFLKARFGDFRFLYENGAEIEDSSPTPVVRFGNVRINLSSVEEFQVFDEVFFNNQYNFHTKRNVYFVDVGMHSGFASLFAASLENVKKVFGFEPFSVPFEKALKNFELNPKFTKKINPNKTGLYDSTNTFEVMVSQESTIGTTIRGVDAGVKESISVVDASTAISKIVKEASSAQCETILKLNCEGSEFPIFDSLQRDGLISSLSGVMIEWHKSWSPRSNADSLIKPLLDEGFFVFDHTTPANIHAGMLYGVKVKA